jgi:hypothetical protein
MELIGIMNGEEHTSCRRETAADPSYPYGNLYEFVYDYHDRLKSISRNDGARIRQYTNQYISM